MDEKLYRVQFSQDGTLYYVVEAAARGCWLSRRTFKDPTAMVAAPRGGVVVVGDRKNKPYRQFLAMSMSVIRTGILEERGAEDRLVSDYLNCERYVPETPKAPETSAVGGKERGDSSDPTSEESGPPAVSTSTTAASEIEPKG